MKAHFDLLLSATLLFLVAATAQATPISTPMYEGDASFNTYSHGGGYSSFDNEYWYSQWSGDTVYRYDNDYNLLGSFTSGQNQMMQIWGETDGSYYSANWGYENITKKAGKDDSTTLWTYNLGTTASGVASDENFVYAMDYYSSTVHKLDSSTGNLIENFSLDNIGTTMYGGLVVSEGYLYRFDYNGYVNKYDLNSGEQSNYNLSDRTQHVYNLSFNGEQVLFSSNSSTSNIYRISDGVHAVPEPAVISLMGLGLAGLLISRRKKT